MMLTLKKTLGIVALIAVVFASLAATLRPPRSTSELPAGLLFGFTLLLFIVGVSRCLAAYPNIDRFWLGFLAACVICAAMGLISPVASANTAPEHIARYIVRMNPSANEPVQHRNERFHALQRIVNNAGVLALAVTCGILAERRRTSIPTAIKPGR